MVDVVDSIGKSSENPGLKLPFETTRTQHPPAGTDHPTHREQNANVCTATTLPFGNNKMMSKSLFLVLVAFGPLLCSAFMGQGIPRSFVSQTSLNVGPLQKLTNKNEYNKVVEGLMQTKGLTREQAEKEYNAYLDNPNDYALQKVCMVCPI